jgi:hypothetical protein
MQNGEGLLLKTLMTRATAVMVFSPPESSVIDWSSFPGGLARISMPDSIRGSRPFKQSS